MNDSNARVRTNAARPHLSVRLVAVLLAALLGASLVVTAPAGAVQPGLHNGQLASSANPVSWTPHVLDGYVESIAEVGSTVVLGGNFTQFRAANSETVINRSHVFSFEKGSGTINAGFDPIVNGEVTSVLSTGDGQTVWIAGGFSQLNGQTVRSIAKVNLATGERVTQFNPPAFNGRIHDMALRNGKLYLSGRFTTVGGQAHTSFAAVNPVTGALDPNVKATFSAPRSGGSLSILASDISPDGSKLVAIGNFTKVNGLDRYQIAVLDLTTSPISVADWSTTRYGDGCSRSFQSYMRDIDISPDGSYFAVATTGAYASPTSAFLCDTAARWELGATGSALQPTWAQYTGGDTTTEVAITDTAVYVGGHYSYMNNPYIGDSIAAGAVPRESLSAHDPRTGTTLSWNPGRTRGYGVYGFHATDSGLWIGSDTDRISGDQYRGRIAFLPLAGGAQMPTEFVGTLPGQVVSLGLMQSVFGSTLDRTTSRNFTGTAVTASATANGTSSWRNLRGSFMIDGQLYTGWSDGTFKVQSYDGTTFGPQTTIPLQLVPGVSASLNRFASEDLAEITGMFYDRPTGRIYFTKSGSNQLHWRGFAPESRVVGAQRFSSATGAGGVSWDNVQTMFLADGMLYTSSSSGNLVRRDWNATSGLPVSGTNVTVSGPAVDGQDWRARDAFVYATSGVEIPNVPPTAAFSNSCTDGVCQFDGAASADADGQVVGYSWDFGDSTSPGTGVTASHVYAASGTYTVSLTVTDNRGATTTTSQQVQVQVPNLAPTANFTSSCAGLTCTFDGTSSSDPDGTVQSFDWTFGDGATATGPTAEHTYAAAGSYTASLTVTDDAAAVNTKTAGVSVIDPNQTPTVEFRAAASANVNGTTARVTVPASVATGDQLVLLTTVNNLANTVTGPAGWTLLNSASDTTATVQTLAWTKRATAGDAGSSVAVTNSAVSKTAVQLLAYSGAESVSAHQVAIDTVSRAERTTPLVPVAQPGSRLIAYWADKSNDTGPWTLPAEATLRNQTIGSGSGNITAAVADVGPVGIGTAGGLTATADSANRRGVVWSIVVAPDTAPQNAAPTASFTSSCTGLSCTFDAANSADTDGTITSYAWNFGGGATATGPTASRTFAAAGTYTVTLTVTDDDAATGTASRQVTVTQPTAANVAFRASGGTNLNSTSPSLTIPASVQAGDVMVLFSTVNRSDTTVTGPAGWTLVNSVSDATAGVQSHLWTRTAAATDAGTTVRTTNGLIAKTALQVAAYSSASGISAQAVSLDAINRAERTTPLVPVATAGSALVSYWADKSTDTTTWTVPAAAALRNLSVGTSSGHITAALADTGSLVAGTGGGLTATANSVNRRGVVWSVVIAPSV